jgi:ABC-type bacteriocin/lantibiotic exporter with double-glycine peptidase domain
VDVEQIVELAYTFPLVARLPIQLIFSFGFLFYYFGYSLFTGVGVAVLFVLMNFIVAKIRAKLAGKILTEKDKRMRHTTEVVNNIKVIKLYSWKDYFVSKIMGYRGREIFLIKLDILVEAISCFVSWLISPGLTLSTFLVFFIMGNDISVAKAFAAYQVFAYLDMPLRWIPEFASSYMQFKVSMKRIQKFLLCNEMNPDLMVIKPESLKFTDIDLKIEGANFTWSGLKQEEKDSKKKKKKKDTRQSLHQVTNSKNT